MWRTFFSLLQFLREQVYFKWQWRTFFESWSHQQRIDTDMLMQLCKSMNLLHRRIYSLDSVWNRVCPVKFFVSTFECSTCLPALTFSFVCDSSCHPPPPPPDAADRGRHSPRVPRLLPAHRARPADAAAEREPACRHAAARRQSQCHWTILTTLLDYWTLSRVENSVRVFVLAVSHCFCNCMQSLSFVPCCPLQSPSRFLPFNPTDDRY